MRRLITLTLLLTSLVMTGWAQGTASYFTLCDDALSGTSGMTVKAILDLSNDNISWGWSTGRYQVAAFIEGECHAIALEGESENMTYWSDRDQYGNWFVLNISYTSARRSKPITFKLYNRDTGLEYNLTNDDNIRSIGINMGSDSKPIVLNAVEATDMSFTDFEMKVNAMQDLSSKLVFTPSGATCPNNLEFEIYPSTYTLTVTGNGGYQFTPSATGSYDISHYQYGLAFRDGTITVTRATNYVSSLSINAGYETIEVNRGDDATLGDMLNWALNVIYYYDYEPDEYPVWESSNTSVVRQDGSGAWMPVGKGTCTMTAKVFKTPGDPASGVRKSASLTVKVTNDVQSLDVLHDRLYCYVADDLTDYLLRTVQMVPADADTPDWTYEIVRGNGILEKRNGRIVAVGEGSCNVEIYAVPGVYQSIGVTVQNAYTDISIAQAVLSIKYTGGSQDISDAVKGNISYLPATAASFAGFGPTVTSNNTDVVSVEMVPSPTGTGTDLTATAYGKGRATITVRLESPDLLEESVSAPGTNVDPKVVSKSFDVVMSVDLSSISFNGRYYSMNVDETFDFTDELSGYPSGADLDKSKIKLSVPNDYKNNVRIEGLKVTALAPTAPKEFELTATMDGTELTATTDLCIYSPATAINVNSGYETIEVYLGESTKLTEAMNKAFSLVPTNSTDGYYYEIADNTIVSYDDVKETFTPLMGGTTKITAIVSGNSSLRAELTVKVLVRAGGISFSARDYAMNVGEKKDFAKELGVYPEDAVFDWSKVSLSVPDDYKNHVRIEGLKVTALLPTVPGEFTLTATVSGTDITAETSLRIYSPATAINVNSGYETIEVYVGEGTKLTEAMNKAFSLVPANSTDGYYYEIADNTIVSYDDVKQTFTPLKGGTTKITAIVSGNSSLKAELTVKVLVKAGSIRFAQRDYELNVGETTDFRSELSVYPENAEFDWSKVVLSVPNDYKDYVKIDGLKVTALQPYTNGFTLTATVEGTDITADVPLFIYCYATAIKVNSGFETIEVYVGDGETLTKKLKSAITLEPANTTDYHIWQFDDETIVEYDTGKKQYVPLKGGTTKATAMVYSNRSMKAELTIKVLEPTVPATSIWLPRYDNMNVGETLDLKTLLEVYPEGADFDINSITWSLGDGDSDKATVKNGVVTALAPGSITVYAKVAGTTLEASIDIDIFLPATSLAIRSGYETITVTVGDKEALTEALTHAYVLTPANSTDIVNWRYSDGSLVEEEYEWFIPVKAGTTKITYYIGNYSEPRLTAELTLVIKEPEASLTELTITIPDPLVVGVSANITVKGNAGAIITPGSLKVNETNSYGWKVLQQGEATAKGDGTVIIAVTPLCPGDLKVSVSHGKVTSKAVDAHVGVAATLVKGWQWKTLWGADLKNAENMYGMNVDDIRTQLTTGSRDEDGYFGSTSTKELTAYKIKAANDISASNAKVFLGGTILTTKAETKLYNGWTWIPYPYVHAFTPAQLDLDATPGDRIVSKDEGFAEYGTDGWTGDLLTLEPYQSYLYFNNSNAEAILQWQPEVTVFNTAAARVVGNASQRSVVGEASKLCNYDPTISRRFRDNMTIIARIASDSPVAPEASAASETPSLSTLAAFVGDECRGVSHAVNDLLFITVHANAGEIVSFRLYNEETGQFSDVEQKVMMTPMLGTLRNPLLLTANESQGITSPTPSEGGELVTYDLQGRKLSNVKTSSLVIRRQPNGQYRKVLNK